MHKEVNAYCSFSCFIQIVTNHIGQPFDCLEDYPISVNKTLNIRFIHEYLVYLSTCLPIFVHHFLAYHSFLRVNCFLSWFRSWVQRNLKMLLIFFWISTYLCIEFKANVKFFSALRCSIVFLPTLLPAKAWCQCNYSFVSNLSSLIAFRFLPCLLPFYYMSGRRLVFSHLTRYSLWFFEDSCPL